MNVNLNTLIPGFVKAVWTSKKAGAAVAGVGAAITAVQTQGMSLGDAFTLFIVPTLGYGIGQGIADHGKEAAKAQKGGAA